MAMTSMCESDGHWSLVGDCEPEDGTRKNITNAVLVGKSCLNRFRLPANYNESHIEFHVHHDPKLSYHYLPGSQIIFTCRQGFFVYSNLSLVANCTPNGDWSRVADCEPHPCWSRLPKRVLNGKRNVVLVLNGINGATSGSRVNYTCNPYYEIQGPKTVYCLNGQWEHKRPTCSLTKQLCKEKPISIKGNTIIKSVSRVELNIEHLNTNKTEPMTIFARAIYICSNGKQFQNKSNIGIREFNGLNYAYKNVSCIGPNKWEPIPECV
jgi:hypothetical protein